jgi:hypothetical protein
MTNRKLLFCSIVALWLGFVMQSAAQAPAP